MGNSKSQQSSSVSVEKTDISHNVKSTVFDFNIVLKLDELTSTKASDIKSFLALITCYNAMLTPDGKTVLINFIVPGKIKGETKTRLGSATFNTLAD